MQEAKNLLENSLYLILLTFLKSAMDNIDQDSEMLASDNLPRGADTVPLEVAPSATPSNHYDMNPSAFATEGKDYNIRLDSEMICDYISPTIVEEKGVLVQFSNQNCPGAASVIGGLRLGISDIRRIPEYLARHKTWFRAQAGNTLLRHLSDHRSSVGAGDDTLSADDFGISFTLGSLSNLGKEMNPGKRNEGPLWYCLYPALVDPIFLGYREDGTSDYAHVVNCYIHLLEADKRRDAVLKKKEEKAKAAAAPSPAPIVKAPAPISNLHIVRGPISKNMKKKVKVATVVAANTVKMEQQLASQQSEIKRLKLEKAKLEKLKTNDPPLPKSQLTWGKPVDKFQVPKLPEEL
jgi:hypothetical protein